MTSPAFTQQQPRSLGVPIVLALLVLIAAAIWYSLSMREGPMTISVAHTAVIGTETVYKSDSMVMAPPHTESTLFIAPELVVVNHRKLPVTLSDFQLTIADASGAQLVANPLSAAEIASAEQSFPQIQPSLAGSALHRETEIAPGATFKGTLVFTAAMSKTQWDTMKTARLNVDVYNQSPIVLELK